MNSNPNSWCSLTVTMTHSPAWRRRRRDPKLTRSEARSSRNHELQRNYRTEFPLPDTSQRQNRHIARDTKSNTRRKFRCNDCQGGGRKPRGKDQASLLLPGPKILSTATLPRGSGRLSYRHYLYSLSILAPDDATQSAVPTQRNQKTQRQPINIPTQEKRPLLLELKLAQQIWHATG